MPFSCAYLKPFAACLNQRTFLCNGILSALDFDTFPEGLTSFQNYRSFFQTSKIARNYLDVNQDVYMLDAHAQHHSLRPQSVVL